MSQNGPHEGADPPYAEPSDPWGDYAVADPSWSGTQQAIPPEWTPGPISEPLLPPRRSRPMVTLVVALAVLVVVGLGVAGWLLNSAEKNKGNQAQGSPAATYQSQPPTSGNGSDDGYNVKANDCVSVVKKSPQPVLHKSACTDGTYKVLKKVTGKTTGPADAKRKCASVAGYNDYFFYDSPFDQLDYVLCLKQN